MGKSEHETIAANIITIMKRTGDEWRALSWDEYRHEREKDGNFGMGERKYFDDVIEYTASALDASYFCAAWKQIYKQGLSDHK
jgi:hypothetical protein